MFCFSKTVFTIEISEARKKKFITKVKCEIKLQHFSGLWNKIAALQWTVHTNNPPALGAILPSGHTSSLIWHLQALCTKQEFVSCTHCPFHMVHMWRIFPCLEYFWFCSVHSPDGCTDKIKDIGCAIFWHPMSWENHLLLIPSSLASKILCSLKRTKISVGVLPEIVKDGFRPQQSTWFQRACCTCRRNTQCPSMTESLQNAPRCGQEKTNTWYNTNWFANLLSPLKKKGNFDRGGFEVVKTF